MILPLCFGETPPAVLCPQQEKEDVLGGTMSREGYENAQRAAAPLLWRQDERAGVTQPGEEKTLR